MNYGWYDIIAKSDGIHNLQQKILGRIPEHPNHGE